MKLKTVNNIFVLEDTTYNERHIPKTAGFRWHNTPGNCLGKCAACVSGIGRVWWTNIPSNALLLRECADEEAIKVLDKTQEEIERSRAFEPTIDIDLPVPAGKDYLPYQKAGIIYSLTKDRVLIGDVMGLGKTIQSIGVLNALPEMADRCLIVAPPSLRTNWTNEINAWKTRDWTVHNVDKTKDIVDNKHLITRDGIKRIFVISYNQVTGQRAAEARNFILSLRWNLVVVDEAHLYKNPKSQRSKAILGTYTKDSLSTPGVAHVTDKLLLLTGTAIANRPVELFPLLRVLDPNGLGSSFMRYAHRYCAAHRGRFGWDFSGSSNLTELQEVLRSGIMIRRNKEEVLKDLPTKTRHIVELDADGAKSLVEKQANAYLKHEEAINYLEDCIDLANEIDDKEAFKEASSLLQEAHQTAFKDMARERKALAIAKVPVVIEHVENILESCDSSVLVFAHHKEVVAKLKEHFKTNLVITGDTPTTKRQGIVEAFQRKEHRVFIGNIISAGVGLTLTAADKVVFAELDWVPANMLQAEDRCVLEGQKILTVNGWKLIENIDVGDLVIGKEGLPHRVTDKWSKLAKGSGSHNRKVIVDIAVRGWMDPLRVTSDHLVLTTDGWKEACRILPGDKIALPSSYQGTTIESIPFPDDCRVSSTYTTKAIASRKTSGRPKPESTQKNGRLVKAPANMGTSQEDMFVFGYYIGDGFSSTKKGKGRFVSFAGNLYKKEAHLKKCIAWGERHGAKASLYTNKKDLGAEVRVYSAELAFWFEKVFGRVLHEKHIPEWVYTGSTEQRKAFIDGLIASDGYVRPSNKDGNLRYEYITASERIAADVVRLFSSVGHKPCLTIGTKGQFSIQYTLGLECAFTVSTVSMRLPNNKERVYDLTVQGSESFVVGASVVHNCHRISQQNQVLVQYLVFNGSIDAKMAKILVSKMEVIEKALDKSSDKDHDRRAYLAMTKEKSTKTKKNFQPLTDEQKKIAEEVIMQLDNACDGARKNDGAGFNKVDALFGRTLAERAKSRGLSDAEANAAKKIIQKYRRQVDNEYLGILFGAEMAMGGEECRSMLG